jgi:hypothetical protein
MALGQLEDALVQVPVETLKEEKAIWRLVLPPSLELAAGAAERGETAAALSLLEALHSIQALTRKRLGLEEPGGQVDPPTASYQARWTEVLALIPRGGPAEQDRIRRLEKPFEK